MTISRSDVGFFERQRTVGFILGVVLAGFFVSSARAQWVQWGGTDEAFIADSKGLANDWPTEGPKKLWQRDLGDGYSSILVDNGRLYTMYRKDEGEEAVVICLDAKSGNTVWEYAYAESPKDGHEKRFGQGPRSTPLIVGDRIYTIGVSGQMHCLDKNEGKVLWSHNLWDEFGGNVQQHGYSSSPIAYKNNVIVLVGGKEKGAGIVAFDQKDGSVAWKNLEFENSYSTPKILKIHGEDQLVTFMAEQVIGADPNTGELKWSFGHKNEWKQNVCMPVVTDKNILFISSPKAGARGLQITKKGNKFDVEEVWATRKIQFYHVTAVQQGDTIYGSTGTMGPAFMASVNINTGKINWRKRGFAKATTIMADGKLIILDEDGNLGLATATPDDFVVHSKAQVLEKVSWTVPTVVGKTLFARDKKSIMAFDLG
ncbi:MAG: PQQ-binding-like beta-propeller repeat protein [Planctomycetes bacterium]|nr:PQQ-binding-like beta-propeller repeat protein [Planctomycetota bacterium]